VDTMTTGALASRLEFAKEIAVHAGGIALGHYRTGVAIEWKPDRSPVTAADREAERALRAAIERRFPAEGIVGEELGIVRPGTRRTWYLDPIDGTRSFVRGVPLWGVMVGLVEAGEPVLGVVHLPALGETVCAARGEGCWLNDGRARVSDVASTAEALVVTTDVQAIASGGRADGWSRIAGRAGLIRTWADCYGYVLVASGRAEAMIDPVLNVWDAVPVLPIVEEAGGVVTDLDGLRRYDGGHLIGTNAALAAGLRALLRTDG